MREIWQWWASTHTHTHTHTHTQSFLWVSDSLTSVIEVSLFATERAKMRDLRERHGKRELRWERHEGWEERNGY